MKVEAYCRRPQGTPTPVVPVPSPIPVNPIPIFPPIPVTPVVPPTPVVPIDPCICGDNALPFGCQSTSLCPTFLICYARVPCTGFKPSRLRPGGMVVHDLSFIYPNNFFINDFESSTNPFQSLLFMIPNLQNSGNFIYTVSFQYRVLQMRNSQSM